MGCFDDCLNNISEPYGGNMPLFNSPNTNDASVTIVSESYDDGMRVTKISTPPRTETKTLIEAIDMALGLVHNMDIGEKSDNKEDGKKTEKKDGEQDVSYLQSERKPQSRIGDGGDDSEPSKFPGSKPSDVGRRVAEKDQQQR